MNELSFKDDNDDLISIEGSEISSLSDDDEIMIKNSKDKNKSKKKKVNSKQINFKPTVKPERPVRVPVPPPPQTPFHDKTFESFANTEKRLPAKNHSDEDDNEDDDDDDDVESQESAQYENNNYPDNYESNDNQPSPGFNSIEDEKQDLLYRFHRLEQKGIKIV